MADKMIRLALLFVLALLVGTMFGILIGYDPASLSAQAYVEQQQNAIGALNTLLPSMGAVCILLTLALAFLNRANATLCWLLVAAALLMVVAALVTRFGNQPINAVVMTWNAESPAGDWQRLRDVWWQWHTWRTVAGVSALALVIFALLSSSRARR